MSEDEALRYPIGRFHKPETISSELVTQWIDDIAQFPTQLALALDRLPADGLSLRYRPGSWTVRQVVHHVADSHLNAYIRFKWALTEDTPTIKAYAEKGWAETPEVAATPVAISQQLLEALHVRWITLLRALSPEDLQRQYIHPDSGATSLQEAIGMYSWHARHHLAHIHLVL